MITRSTPEVYFCEEHGWRVQPCQHTRSLLALYEALRKLPVVEVSR